MIYFVVFILWYVDGLSVLFIIYCVIVYFSHFVQIHVQNFPVVLYKVMHVSCASLHHVWLVMGHNTTSHTPTPPHPTPHTHRCVDDAYCDYRSFMDFIFLFSS